MPLPIGHTLVSAGIFAAYRGQLSIRDDWRWLALFALAGLLPDIDFVMLPFSGFGAHRGLTHSFAFAAVSASALFALVRAFRGSAPWRLLAFLMAAAAAHPLCDYFTYDYLVERGGVQLLFPFSESYYQSPFSLFMGIELRYMRTIFSAHTLAAIAWEAALSGAFLLAVLLAVRGGARMEAREKAE